MTRTDADGRLEERISKTQDLTKKVITPVSVPRLALRLEKLNATDHNPCTGAGGTLRPINRNLLAPAVFFLGAATK